MGDLPADAIGLPVGGFEVLRTRRTHHDVLHVTPRQVAVHLYETDERLHSLSKIMHITKSLVPNTRGCILVVK